MLVQCDIKGAGDGVFARVLVSGEEDGETLLVARRMRFTEDLDDFGVGEPLWNLLASSETLAEFCMLSQYLVYRESSNYTYQFLIYQGS